MEHAIDLGSKLDKIPPTFPINSLPPFDVIKREKKECKICNKVCTVDVKCK